MGDLSALIHKLVSPFIAKQGVVKHRRTPEVGTLFGNRYQSPPAPQVSVVRRGAHKK